jgi:hypothetical protein
MSEPIILFPAIFVFSMLLIGLVLTMWEFSRLSSREPQQVNRNRHSKRPARDTDFVLVPGYSGA